ncbi:hypothetical protein INR49_001018 [Caranx melampygus]|nr:hypothetical protein INR49_001018 [Caranx melampygus]
MAEGPALSLRVSEIKNPVDLFERYNTDEIRQIERKVRAEIEQKKEELRQMVGERYRDLIDAADTIGEMRQCSESVVRSIEDMHQYCQQLKQGKAGVSGCSQESQRQWQEKFYTMAAQIKLLLEIPERIWSAMEASQYLQATQLYLLCCHLHSLLQLDTAAGGHYSPILARFPILVRQVATTGHFRSTILLDSRSLLRGRAVSDQAIAESLVSTMLLEDSSPRQALADFLLARKASIHQLLNQPQHEGGPRPGERALSCGLLFSILENVTSTSPAAKVTKVLQEESSTGSWFRHLPPSITEFQPTLRTLAQPIQREQLRDTLQQWIDMCKEDICRGVGSLLVYVKSLKGLAAIRDAVWDLLSTDSISQHWSSVCQQLLECPLAVWDDFLQQLFLQRLQAITKEETEAISASSVQLLSSAVGDLEGQAIRTSSGSSRGAQYEVDVSSFLWSESTGDLLSDAGGLVWPSGGQQQQRSGLAMKTQALTPCVQNFCSCLDAKLKARLDDLQHYLPSQDTVSSSGSANDSSPSHLIVTWTHQRWRRLCVKAPWPVCDTSSPPSAPNWLQPRPTPAPVNLGDPEAGQEAGQSEGRCRAQPTEAKWASLKEELSAAAWRRTASGAPPSPKSAPVLLDKFGSVLHAGSAGAVLTTATNWEDLEIQEEAESGSSITSKIRLPVQVRHSILVRQSLLFQLCVEVNKVGSHALPQPTCRSCYRLDGVCHMTQNRALQLLFDLRYLNTTLGSRQEEGKSSRSHQDHRFHEVCDWLESFIDPFDLDVFTPPLNATSTSVPENLGTVLLGLLTGSEKQFTSRSSSVNSQELYTSCRWPAARSGLASPLSMSNTSKSRSETRSSETPQQLVSNTLGPFLKMPKCD